ncbi:MAG: DUF11 domain-containing protein [Aeromicrobium sp.]
MNHRSRLPRRLAALLTALATVALVLVAAPAANAVVMNVSIQPTSATTQPSGSQFSYQVNFACLGTNAPTCADAELTIPLTGDVDMTGWAFEVTGGPAGFIESWSVDAAAGALVIALGDMNAGASQGITVRLTPPNLQTPDGTSWSLLPTVSSPDPAMDDSSAPTAATGTATATVPLSIAKTSPRSFYYEGTTVTYTITATCPATKPVGSVFAASMTIVDVLPAGLVLVDPDEYDYDPATREIRWEVAAGQLPAACGGPVGTPAVTRQVVATVGPVGPTSGDAFASYTEVANTATVTAVPAGGGSASAPQQATRTIVVLDTGDLPQPGTRSLGKSATGPLRHADAPAAPAGTYPGRWLPNGIAQDAPASVLDASPGSYSLTPRVQYEEFQYEIRDRMPCLEGDDNVFTPSTGLCATPAFHPIAVRIGFSGPAPDAGYTPLYVDNRDGLTHPMSVSSTGSGWSSWVIPTAAISHVAEIVIPRDVSQELRRTDTITVHGFADAATTAGDVLQNRGEVTWFLRSEATPYGTPQLSNTADIFVLDGPQLGMQKSMTNIGGATGTRANVSLTATLQTPGVPADGVVVTDLLPLGSELVTENLRAVVRQAGGADIVVTAPQLQVEVVDDHLGTGRQLLRVTVPVDVFTGPGRYVVALDSFVVTKPTQPGTYTNSAQVFHDNASTLGQCSAGEYRSDDADGLRPGSVTAVANCEASATFVTALSSEGQFTLAKTVKGDYDDAPVAYPAIGHVALESGVADYSIEWTNVGAPTLEGVVLYDVFPHVGDTGVSGGQAGEQRDSEFRPVLASIDAAPAGVTVSYSASTDPCRAEVYPSQPSGCVDDWTTDAEALGGLGEVMAIRLTSTAEYITGAGITLGFRMSVPTVDRDLVAWNSVAAFAQTTSGITLEPSEAPKVGITASENRFGLGKVADVTTTDRGENVVFTVTVRNAGTEASEPTTVTDELPVGLDLVSSEPAGVWDADGRSISWDVPSLPAGDELEFEVVAVVTAGAIGPMLTNRAVLQNPVGYSPVIVSEECADDAGEACATVRIPPAPPLAHAGVEVAGIVAAALLALGLGAVVVMTSRRRPLHRA